MNEGWPLSGTFSTSLCLLSSFDIFMKELQRLVCYSDFWSGHLGITTGRWAWFDPLRTYKHKYISSGGLSKKYARIVDIIVHTPTLIDKRHI